MKYIITSILFFVLISIVSCNEIKPVMCTEEFRMITVSVKNNNGIKPQPLNYYMINADTGDTVVTHQNIHNNEFIDGIVIFSDSEMKYTSEKGKVFFLKVYYNDSLKATEPYLIRHDKCHIELLNGKTEIVIN